LLPTIKGENKRNMKTNVTETNSFEIPMKLEVYITHSQLATQIGEGRRRKRLKKMEVVLSIQHLIFH